MIHHTINWYHDNEQNKIHELVMSKHYLLFCFVPFQVDIRRKKPQNHCVFFSFLFLSFPWNQTCKYIYIYRCFFFTLDFTFRLRFFVSPLIYNLHQKKKNIAVHFSSYWYKIMKQERIKTKSRKFRHWWFISLQTSLTVSLDSKNILNVQLELKCR